jgi:membrane protein DedA with SNARE-associated domain
MDDLVARFGYLAVFVGSFLEGETILAFGRLAAQQGYVSFVAVIGVGAAGGFLGDQLFFFIGRRYGNRVLARFPAMAAKAPRVRALVQRWDVAAVILIRFIYGLRIAGPIVIGSCGIPAWRLALLNLVGALVWAPLVAGAGWLAGQALEQWIGHLRHAEIVLLMAAVLAVTVGWLLAQWRHR